MKRPIVKNTDFLKIKSTMAHKEDTPVIADLKDTLEAHADECVGLAANMIGYPKQMIIVQTEKGALVMINPEIKKRVGKYEASESCLSLFGERKAVRYKEIEVKFLDEQFKPRRERFSGFTAQVIQHECDHLKGIII